MMMKPLHSLYLSTTRVLNLMERYVMIYSWVNLKCLCSLLWIVKKHLELGNCNSKYWTSPLLLELFSLISLITLICSLGPGQMSFIVTSIIEYDVQNGISRCQMDYVQVCIHLAYTWLLASETRSEFTQSPQQAWFTPTSVTSFGSAEPSPTPPTATTSL